MNQDVIKCPILCLETGAKAIYRLNYSCNTSVLLLSISELQCTYFIIFRVNSIQSKLLSNSVCFSQSFEYLAFVFDNHWIHKIERDFPVTVLSDYRAT
jgi:hypothetical protein